MGIYFKVVKAKQDSKIVLHEQDSRHPPTIWHPQGGWACIDTNDQEYVVYPTPTVLRKIAEGLLIDLAKNVDAPEIVPIGTRVDGSILYGWKEPEPEPEEDPAPKRSRRRVPPPEEIEEEPDEEAG